MGRPRGKRKTLREQVTNLRLWVASLIVVAAGVAFLLVAGAGQSFWHRVAGSAGSALLSIGGIGVIYDVWLRRSLGAEFLSAAGLREDIADTGIERIVPFAQVDWRSFFTENPGDVEIVVGYARSWTLANAEMLTRIVGGRNGRVKMTVLDPDGPNWLLNFYAETYGAANAAELQGRINEVIGTWREYVDSARSSGRTAHVVIDGITRHVPYTFYVAGDRMWVVFSPRAPGRHSEDIPAVLCHRTGKESGIFDWVMKDIDACRREGHTRELEEMKT